MSTRTTLRPHSVILDGDMSEDITSDVTILASLTKIGYSLSWTGTSPVGSVSVEVSNEYALDGAGNVLDAGSDWTTLTLSLNGAPVQAIDIAGNTGSAFIDIETCSAYAIRLLYTFDSGVGTLQAKINGKVA